MIRLLLIILVILFFTNCKKGVDYVRGTVVDVGTGIPVENATVYLVRNKLIKMPNYEVHAIDSAITNVNGEFHIKYFKVPFSNYSYGIRKENYYGLIWTQSNLLTHRRTAVTIEATPYSYIKIKYNKTSSSTKYIWGNILQNTFYSPGNTHQTLSGPFTIYSSAYQVWGGRPVNLTWKVFDSNDTIISLATPLYTHQEKITIPKSDTLIYTISY